MSPRKPGRELHGGRQTHLDAGMEKNCKYCTHVVGHSEVHKAQSARVFDFARIRKPHFRAGKTEVK